MPTTDDPSNPRSELRNKEETELPIGESREPASRDYALWRCGDCGEMGRLAETLPTNCPSCGASREVLYYWEED